MTLTFRDKLNLLLSVYRLSSAALSKGIGADASLISRWRSGERLPAKPAATAGDIAAYLSGTPLLAHDRALLETLTGRSCLCAADTETAVLAWLTESAPPPPDDGEALCVTMASLLSAAPMRPAHASLWPHVRKGRPAELEVFSGAGGMRQATVNFLHEAQAPGTGDLFLYGWHDPSWFEADELFSRLWTDALRALPRAGRTLHLLASPALTLPALTKLLEFPLFSAGRTTLCRAETVPASLFFWAENACAVLSDGETTLLTRAPQAAALCRSMLACFRGAEMLEVCHGPGTWQERLLALEDTEGGLWAFRGGLSGLFVPLEALQSFLTAQLPETEARQKLEALARRRDVFASRSRKDRWLETIPAAVFDAIALNGSCRLPAAEFFGAADGVLSGTWLRATLLALRAALDRPFGRFRLALTNDALPVDVTLKPGRCALFSLPGAGGASCACLGDLTRGLEPWFELRTLSRDQALARLDEALAGL